MEEEQRSEPQGMNSLTVDSVLRDRTVCHAREMGERWLNSQQNDHCIKLQEGAAALNRNFKCSFNINSIFHIFKRDDMQITAHCMQKSKKK